jgi:hypothetical protein
MDLSKTARNWIGVGTIGTIALPLLAMVLMLLMVFLMVIAPLGFLPMAFIDLESPSPVAIGFSVVVMVIVMILSMLLQFLAIAVMFVAVFLILGMQVFYVIHAVKNKAGDDTVRLILALGFFFLPYVAMPVYYYAYLWSDEPPDWALNEPATEAV